MKQVDICERMGPPKIPAPLPPNTLLCSTVCVQWALVRPSVLASLPKYATLIGDNQEELPTSNTLTSRTPRGLSPSDMPTSMAEEEWKKEKQMV